MRQVQAQRKNYIGLLSDRIEEQAAAKSPTKSDRLLRDFFLGLMSGVLNRRNEADSRYRSRHRTACGENKSAASRWLGSLGRRLTA